MKHQHTNILLLSAGRRVSLARALRLSARKIGADFITADMHPEMSAACQDNGQSATLPNVLSKEYPDALRRLCNAREIGMVVPTIDTELSVLSSLRNEFAESGIQIVVCDLPLIQSARDKRQTARFFAKFDVESPRLYEPDDIRFPAIAKPFDGSLSRDVSVLHSGADLNDKILATPNIMFAEYLDHKAHEKFTCDAYYNKAGLLCCVVPRQRLEVRGGEASKARAVRNDIVPMFFKKLSRIEGARGCLTFQFFRHKDTGRHWLIELNPRFGGGYPLTIAAGAEYHDWLVREYLLGCDIQPWGDWRDGLTMLRYDAEVLVNA